MANIDFKHLEQHLSPRGPGKRASHVQYAQAMLVAAGLSTLGVVAVAGAMLVTLF